MTREYLVHIREPMTETQRADLLTCFPVGRPSARPHLFFLHGSPDGRGPRSIVDFASRLGLHARVVEL